MLWLKALARWHSGPVKFGFAVFGTLWLALAPAQSQPTMSAVHWAVQHWQPDGRATTLASLAADTPTHPASITKLLSAYVVLQAIASGEQTLTRRITISAAAAGQDGSRVGYRAGERVAVQDALQGLLAISGNDAAWALAEHVGGDVPTFVARMNAASSALKLSRSQWQNPHGLTQEGHASSAADLATLAHVLWTTFPQARPWLGVKTYTWNGVTQSNRNSLLWRDATVDGLKTGHTEAAGYNLAASSVWRVNVGADAYDWRLSSVALGAPSAAARVSDTAALLAWARSAYVPWRLYAAGAQVGTLKLAGAIEPIPAHAAAPLWLVLPKATPPAALRYELSPSAAAPVAAGAVIGTLRIYEGQTLLASAPVVSLAAIARAPWIALAWQWVKSWFE